MSWADKFNLLNGIVILRLICGDDRPEDAVRGPDLRHVAQLVVDDHRLRKGHRGAARGENARVGNLKATNADLA